MSGDAATSEMVWNAVMEAGKEFGILPCGLGARNTLRLEAKMRYTATRSAKRSMLGSGADRYCKMEKRDFIGERRWQSFRGPVAAGAGWIANDGTRNRRAMSTKFFDAAGEEVGVVTSGSPSPTLRVNIALAYVPPALAALGTQALCGSADAAGEGFGGANAVLQARQKISAASNSAFELTWQISARGERWHIQQTIATRKNTNG